jgi:serine protease Do
MRYWKFLGIAVVMAGVFVGALAVAPGTRGQAVVSSEDHGDQRHIELLGGSGSRIGVSVRDIEQADAQREKIAASTGVVIDEVHADSPASKAGVKAGDVVVEFDGERVRSSRQFSRLVQESVAGRTVKAAVMRDGKKVDITVTPEARPGFEMLSRREFGPAVGEIQRRAREFSFSFPERFEASEFGSWIRPGRLGINIQSLSPQLAEYFGVKAGVLVTSVTSDSVAAKVGVKAGDVIKAIDGSTVSDADDLRRRMSRIEEGKEFSLEIVRDRKPMTLKGRIERRESLRPARRRSA